MNSVFVVVAGIDYEGSAPIRAFAERSMADDFASVCRQYEATSPRSTDFGTPEEAKAWYDGLKAWEQRHPGGEKAHGSDYFVVIEVPLGPFTAACAATPADSQKGEGDGR